MATCSRGPARLPRAAHNGGGGMSVALRRVDVLGLWDFRFLDVRLRFRIRCWGSVGFRVFLGYVGSVPSDISLMNVEIFRIFDCRFCARCFGIDNVGMRVKKSMNEV